MAESFLARIEPQKPIRQTPSAPAKTTDKTTPYGKAVLDDKCQAMRNTVEGTRNETLRDIGRLLGGFVGGGEISWNDAHDQLRDAAEASGLDYDEVEQIPRHLEYGMKEPLAAPEKPQNISPVSSIQIVENASENTPSGAGIAANNPFGEVPPVDGANWMFDADDTVVELWGQGDEILWAEGEALMICGGMGLGKSTLAGKLLRAQLGLQDKLLDLPVTPIDKPILYLAMDRPRQLRRAMRRQFSEEEKALIAGRLLIRPGPPIMDMALDPTLLARMAEAVGAGVVYVDSLKDAVVGLSADETAANYNRARQKLLASGVEVCELHHSRKPSADSTGGVADVYGSTWLASGAGSVILLSGEPGDLVVKFRHVKTPANEVGPWHLLLDPDKGEFTVQRCDLLVSARNSGASGLSAEDAAKDLYDTRRPTKSQQKKAERHLANLEAKNLLRRIEGRGGSVWFPVETRFEEPFRQVSGEMF